MCATPLDDAGTVRKATEKVLHVSAESRCSHSQPNAVCVNWVNEIEERTKCEKRREKGEEGIGEI